MLWGRRVLLLKAGSCYSAMLSGTAGADAEFKGLKMLHGTPRGLTDLPYSFKLDLPDFVALASGLVAEPYTPKNVARVTTVPWLHSRLFWECLLPPAAFAGFGEGN